MPKAGSALIAVLVMIFSIATVDTASGFSCPSGKPGQGSCTCQGTADCNDMRHSEMCKGDLTCSQGSCSCTAARAATTGPQQGGSDPAGKKGLNPVDVGGAVQSPPGGKRPVAPDQPPVRR
jgi:hypothetical protein